MWTAFEYMYRDAGNFKAFGIVVLDGELSSADQQLIRSRLSSGEYFIAEQVNVPPLYEELYKWSGGPTQSDHCWHEFVRIREIRETDDLSFVIPANEFVSRFARLQDWSESCSPHFSLTAPL